MQHPALLTKERSPRRSKCRHTAPLWANPDFIGDCSSPRHLDQIRFAMTKRRRLVK
jgi:hypothetical protein